jgi:predicted DNA-binding transcriptional regulator YafY
VQSSTVRLPESESVAASLLVTLAQACAGTERITLSYEDRQGRRTERRLEPHRVVNAGRRWYLVARDVDRDAWRTLRVDRMEAVNRTGHRFRPQETPPDAATFVTRSVSVEPYRWTAHVAIAAPLDEVRRRVPPTVGLTEADGPDSCLLTTGADDLHLLAGHLILLNLPFTVLDPPELAEHLRHLGRRLARG